MKIFLAFIVWTVSVTAMASDQYPNDMVEKIVQARIAVLHEERVQLDSAIVITESGSLSAAEKYELIAQGAFRATEETLARYGLTVRQLYFLEEKYRDDITDWMTMNSEQAALLTALENEIESLQIVFDQVAGQAMDD
jgi:hypothetical protein